MKRTIYILIILIFIISCVNSQPLDKKNQISNRTTNKPRVFNSVQDSSVAQVRQELLDNYIFNPETYKSLGWSKVEEMYNPIFKFRVFHKFSCAGLKFKPYDEGINEYEMFFHIDSTGIVTALGLKEEYSTYYTKDGQMQCLYSGFEFEKIALDNNLDMLLHGENSKTISIVSASDRIFEGKIGMTKSEFQKKNFINLNQNIFQDIDTVDYCVDMTGEDCKLYIFENNILKQIKNGL